MTGNSIKMIRYIYIQPMPNIIAVLLLCPLFWSGVGNTIKKQKKYWQKGNHILLIIGILSIVYVTLLIREKGYYSHYPIPFHTFYRARHQDKEALRGMLMNLLLFAPFGLFLSEGMGSIPVKRQRKILLFSAFGLSLLIELSQLLLHLGSFETDDLLFNTLGAFLGGMWCLLLRSNGWIQLYENAGSSRKVGG